MEVNQIVGPNDEIIGFTTGDFPLFPTYDFNQSYFMFGEGRPRTLTGKRAVMLQQNPWGIPIIMWGDIIPHP